MNGWMNEAVKGRESERAREWECEGDWVDPLFFTSGMRRVFLAWFFRLSLFHSSSSFLSVHSLLFSFLLGLHGVLPCALHPLLSWRLSLVASVVFLFSCRKKPITLPLRSHFKVNVNGDGWMGGLAGRSQKVPFARGDLAWIVLLRQGRIQKAACEIVAAALHRLLRREE